MSNDFLVMDKSFVTDKNYFVQDNFDFVLDKKYFVWDKASVSKYFFRPPTLTSDIFAAPWPKSLFSLLFERSTTHLFGGQSPWLLSDF